MGFKLGLATSMTVVLTLVSGCVEPQASSPPADKVADGAPAAPNGTLQTFRATYGLGETAVATPASRSGFGGSNCLHVAEPVHIVTGNMTITWSEPLGAPSMELFLFHDFEVYARGTGHGRITVPVIGVDIGGGDPFELIVWQIDNDEPAGVAADLKGNLELDFVYESDSAIEIEEGNSCSIGHN